MFTAKSMMSFRTLAAFTGFYEDLGIRGSWQIIQGHPNTRGEWIRDKPYTRRLREAFMEKGLFRRNVSVAEIVSWLDGFVIVDRLVKELQATLEADVYEGIRLFFEYRIDMSKNRRIDYVFMYRKNILLVEFRLSEKFPNVSNTWHKKELELIIYKELMRNYVPAAYKIMIYAFIAMPEGGGKGGFTREKKYNADNVKYFADYIRKYLLEIES